jgi:hypothetical protein
VSTSSTKYCMACPTPTPIDLLNPAPIHFCPYCGSNNLFSSAQFTEYATIKGLTATIKGIRIEFTTATYRVMRDAFDKQHVFISFHEYVSVVLFNQEPSNKINPDTIPLYHEKPTLQGERLQPDKPLVNPYAGIPNQPRRHKGY